VPNGIEVDRFVFACKSFDRAAFLRANNLPQDCLLVGSIGELRKLKRHDDLIKAARIVADKVPEAHFVIAGVDTSRDSANRKELIELIKHLKLEDRVHLLGWLDDAEKLLCALDVFVSASETKVLVFRLLKQWPQVLQCCDSHEGAQEVLRMVTGVLMDIGNVDELAKRSWVY
jgi:glycosyltransferase involved in cell wall biosynthesis